MACGGVQEHIRPGGPGKQAGELHSQDRQVIDSYYILYFCSVNL